MVLAWLLEGRLVSWVDRAYASGFNVSEFQIWSCHLLDGLTWTCCPMWKLHMIMFLLAIFAATSGGEVAASTQHHGLGRQSRWKFLVLPYGLNFYNNITLKPPLQCILSKHAIIHSSFMDFTFGQMFSQEVCSAHHTWGYNGWPSSWSFHSGACRWGEGTGHPWGNKWIFSVSGENRCCQEKFRRLISAFLILSSPFASTDDAWEILAFLFLTGLSLCKENRHRWFHWMNCWYFLVNK